ncbi:zinc finger MYND domain-containing protein 11-like protein, partial [Dinothrombium tinctorium]
MSERQRKSLSNLPLTTESDDCTAITARVSWPWFVFAVWRQILKLSKKATTKEIAFLMKQENDLKAFSDNIERAVKDGLIVNNNDLLSISNDNQRATHDWYCFRCFKPAKIILKCNGCERVYHDSCRCFCDERKKCFYCQTRIQEPIRKKLLTKDEINDAIDLVFSKLKSSYSSLMQKSTLKHESEVLTRHVTKLLCKPHFNFSLIEAKVTNTEYQSFFEFATDCKTISYNLNVLYGPESEIGKQCEEMYNFVLKEIELLSYCVECYIRSFHKKRDDHYYWFIMP